MKLSERMNDYAIEDGKMTDNTIVKQWAKEVVKLEAENEAFIAEVAGMRDKWTPPDEVAKLEAELDDAKIDKTNAERHRDRTFVENEVLRERNFDLVKRSIAKEEHIHMLMDRIDALPKGEKE